MIEDHTRLAHFSGLVGRHPVTSYLVGSFGLGWAMLFPAALLMPDHVQLAVLPAALLAQFGVAILVTGLTDGRAGVGDLLRRVFRWRVHLGWYLLAALAIPVVALAGASAVAGVEPVRLLLAEPGLITAYLLGLTILPLINLWEETGWMGFVQARLQVRYGPVRAAVLTAPLFGLIHLPLLIGLPVVQMVVTLLIVMVVAVPFRMVLGWFYNSTGGSILITGLFHTAFNAATGSDLLARLLPGQHSDVVAAAVVVLGGLAVLAFTRGRLGRPEPVAGRQLQ